MPQSWNGIGTKFYGRRERRPDGSFLTTEWLVFAHLPVLPLGSYRVIEISHVAEVTGSSTKYEAQRVPLSVLQVISTYAFATAMILPLASGILLPALGAWPERWWETWSTGLVLAYLLGAIWIWPLLCGLWLWGLRRANRKSDARRALRDYSRMIEAEPGNPDLYGQRSTVHSLLGDPRAALADLDRAIRAAPLNWPALDIAKEERERLRRMLDSRGA